MKIDERFAGIVAKLPEDARAKVEAAEGPEELKAIVEEYSESADLTPEELDLVSGGCGIGANEQLPDHCGCLF